MNRLQTQYKTELATKLKSDLKLDNVHQIPRLTKIVVSVGVGRAVQDQKYLDNALATLRKVTGQEPIVTKAKNSIAGFKLREGQSIGAKVTLRHERMFDFLDRLNSVVLPRLRDFRGLSLRGFDAAGNYSLGLSEQTVFPEINYEDANLTHGIEITLVTTAVNPEQGEALMRSLGLPLERKEKN